MFGSGVLPGPATTLQGRPALARLSIGMVVTDGGASLTASPLLVTAVSGTTPNYVLTVAGNYYPPISADATMQASLTTLVPGEYIQNSAITNPVKIVGYGSGAIGLLGNYTLSASPNAAGAVGSSGFSRRLHRDNDHGRRRDSAGVRADDSRQRAIHHLPTNEYRSKDGHDRLVG